MFKTFAKYGTFVAGLYLLTMGVVLIIRSALGTSPISSLNYVMSVYTPVTLGMATFVLNLILIAGQFWFIRHDRSRRDAVEILLQIPFSLIFAVFLDVNMAVTESIAPTGYLWAWGLLVLGCMVQSFGVALELKPNVVVMSAEGFVKYACRAHGWNFGRVKVCFDVTLVLMAVLASLAFGGIIIGVREGTVFSALAVGVLVNFFTTRILNRLKVHSL